MSKPSLVKIEGIPFFKTFRLFKPPMRNNGPLDVNCVAILLHNTGQQTVVINGCKTIEPGGSFSTHSDFNQFMLERWNIEFTGSGTKKLEIVETQIDHHQLLEICCPKYS